MRSRMQIDLIFQGIRTLGTDVGIINIDLSTLVLSALRNELRSLSRCAVAYLTVFRQSVNYTASVEAPLS